jgi:hypothetical protein
MPVLYLALVPLLLVAGKAGTVQVALAWAYVALRAVHSLVQATVNKVIVRFGVFALSSLVLIALIVHAAIAVF